MNRSILDNLRTDDLVDEQLEICKSGEIHKYTLLTPLGPGKTAVAWKARNSLGREVAIKFSPKEEYRSHSLEGEIASVGRLRSQLIARIAYYGEPASINSSVHWNDLYAIVVDWIEGPTLADFLADPATEIDLDVFRQLAKDLCEILADLGSCRLVHNDLHDRNLIVSPQFSPLTRASTLHLVAIDTGQLKTEERRADLLENWRNEIATLEGVGQNDNDAIADRIARLNIWIEYFGRTDQEWVVYHLCALFNRLYTGIASTDSRTRRFLHGLPDLLRIAVDPDPSRRIDDASSLFEQIERLIPDSFASDQKTMQSPFDLPSAELIRSDRQRAQPPCRRLSGGGVI